MPAPLRVLVAGGGFAAAELLLALRELAGDRVAPELVAPQPTFAFKPASTGGAVEVFDLEQLAADAGAPFRRDAVEAVAPDVHHVRLASGAVAGYDSLVLAVGARPRVAVPGAATFRDQRDAARVAGAVAGASRVVFAVPSGVTWTLPLYELALNCDAEHVSIVTPEEAPLEVFGRAVSDAVRSLLADRGIRFIGGTAPRAVGREGLELAYGGSLAADAVVAAPRLVGRRISGVPADYSGFVHSDPRGRVEGLLDVFAAGDITAFPIKQGGLAAQQADVIASLLARRAGADVPDEPVRHVLRTRLLGTDEPLYLHAEVDGDGRPLKSETSTEPPWWPGAKVFGRRLTPWLATHGRRREAAAAAAAAA
ncbi:MAG TPA: FAD-dependent oxidoreductase [Solirubrobacteraceae bacterium]|jgi:sulfide:quinone oxidoreductase